MHQPQIIEVVAAVGRRVAERLAAQELDLRVMRPARGGHLHVPVHDRAAGPPEAVPEHEEVPRGGIGRKRGLAPAPAGHEVVADDGGVGGRQRVVLAEDEDTVVAVVFRDVRRGDPVLAGDAAEGIGRRAGERVVEGVVPRRLDRAADLVAALHLDRPHGAQVVEQRPLEGDVVGHAHDALLRHRLDRAEQLRDPGVHLGWCLEPADRGRHGEDARRGGARIRGKAPDRLLENDDPGHDPRRARTAF